MASIPSYIPCLDENASTAREVLIQQYFSQGMTNVEILSFLAVQHGNGISLSTLKRILAKLGLKRRPGTAGNDDEVRAVISSELVGSGKALGTENNLHLLIILAIQ